MTFLYRHDPGEVKIGLVSNLKDGMGYFEEMARLEGTDIWYITHQLPHDPRETYQISLNGQNEIDPFNPRKFIFPLDEETGMGSWESSILELPDALRQPWINPRSNFPSGALVKHAFQSEILGNEYPVWIYTPPGYLSDGDPSPFLLILDVWAYVHLIPTATILDNLLAEGRLPPLVAIMLGSLSYGDVRKRDYGCVIRLLSIFSGKSSFPGRARSYA